MSTKKTNTDVAAENAAPSDNVQEQKTACVYCGPTVRGVAHQFTVYADGALPEMLQDFLKKHPAAAGLVVAVNAFADIRRRVETKGTAENILYNKIKSEL